MRIRKDFVTNSSSSSFILARKEKLSEKQKEVIINFVIEHFLGGHQEASKECLDRELEYRYNANKVKRYIKSAVEDGQKIYIGSVCFEMPYESLAELYNELWRKLELADPDAFDKVVADFGAWNEGF